VADVQVRISCSVKILYSILSGLSIAVLVQKVNIHISISKPSLAGYEKGLDSSCI
jgi:hypothetical protein